MTYGLSEINQNGVDYRLNDPNIANEFSTSTAYTEGEYVNYNGLLYRFNVAHPAGAWNASHVTEVTMGDEVTDLKSALGHVGSIATASDFTVLGFIESNSGNVNTIVSTWKSTDFISVNNITHFYATIGTFQSSGTTAGFAFYDTSKTYISGVICRTTGTSGYEVRDISVPSNAKYVRLCFRISELNDFFAVGNDPYSFNADTKELGEAISQIREQLGVVSKSDDLLYTGFIEPHTGNVNTVSSTWAYTDYTDIEGVEHILTMIPTFVSSGTRAGLAFYDSSKTYISGVESRVTGTSGFEERVVAVPDNAKYVRFSFRKSDIANYYAIGDKYYAIAKANTDQAGSGQYGIQLFEKIGVIGDSISVGWALDKNGNNSRRNTSISWVQQFARRNGCTAYNLGASGVDPIEWFQPNYEFAEYCYTQYQSVGFCNLYIIGLGLNQGTLGTASDINESDYTQNTNTFYGQYARIIQMINAEHPDAVVMCLTEPTLQISSYDQAVRNICGLQFINAELVDLESDYFDLFNTPEIAAQKQPDGLHYTPYGYSLLAGAMETALNDYIAKNSTHFKYVGVTTV